MDPLTLSGIASVLLKAGPGLIRSVGRWFGVAHLPPLTRWPVWWKASGKPAGG